MANIDDLEKRITSLEKRYQAVFNKEMTLTPEEKELLDRASNGLENVRKFLTKVIIAEILFLGLFLLILLLR